MKKNSFIRLLLLGGILVLGGILTYIYLRTAPQPPIYGITYNLNGSGGHQIVTIDFNTGKESNPISINKQSFGIPHVFGIARKYVQNAGENIAVLSVLEDNIGCGSGTAFYNVDLKTATAAKLGTALPLNPNLANTWIEDIEINPIDNKVYGIYDNQLVRVDDLGQSCYPGNNGKKAIVVSLGTLKKVGVGPYSVSFDHLGTCYIISGKDHRRAAVQLPIVPNSNIDLSIVSTVSTDASWNIPSVVSNINVASCISGTTQIIGLSYVTTPSIPNAFLHFGNPNWTNKGTPKQIRDYTSTAKTLTIFK